MHEIKTLESDADRKTRDLAKKHQLHAPHIHIHSKAPTASELRKWRRASKSYTATPTDNFIYGMSVLLITIYPRTCQVVCAVFDCAELADGMQVVRIDPSVQCDMSFKLMMWPAAAIAFLVYVLGIPVFTFFLMYSKRHHLYNYEHMTADGRPDHPNEIIYARLGFLYCYYKPELYWWETVVLMRKFVMCGLQSAP